MLSGQNISVCVQAKNQEKLIEKVREKYGERAEIISCKVVSASGIRGLLGFNAVEGLVRVNPVAFDQRSTHLYKNKESSFNSKGKSSLAKNEVINIPDNLFSPAYSNALEEEKQKILSVAKERSEMNTITSMLQKISDKLDKQKPTSQTLHPTLVAIKELLEKNEFIDSYIADILEKLQRQLSLVQLEDFDFAKEIVKQLIYETIHLDSEIIPKKKSPRIVVLIGPTGVGKTTTIAKLAADIILNKKESSVDPKIVLLTTDTYRIGAAEQLKRYGELLNVPCHVVKDSDELKKQILFNQDADYILIDTYGKGPKDKALYVEMKQLLDTIRKEADFYLTLSATTKTKDVLENIHNFNIFNYRSIILTKIDETEYVGNIISAFHETGKKFAFITNGQNVPHDILLANQRELFKYLDGFENNTRGVK